MQMTLYGIDGPAAAASALLAEDVDLTVGRAAHAGLPVPADNFMSGLHFSVTQHGDQLRLRDLGSRNGTRLNGAAVQDCLLREGDQIEAGSSRFGVRFHVSPAVPQVEFLSSLSEPLYAVLDAARHEDILPLLRNSGAPYFSLYFGQSAVELETVAPYLVPLPPQSELLKSIIDLGWSHSWGIFLTCAAPTEELWKQLRRSLYVTLPGELEEVYFRFYDPRVLRVFFSAATPQQRAEFCGPISSFFVEDEDPTVMLRFCLSDFAGVEKFSLSPQAPPAPPPAKAYSPATTLLPGISR